MYYFKGLKRSHGVLCLVALGCITLVACTWGDEIHNMVSSNSRPSGHGNALEYRVPTDSVISVNGGGQQVLIGTSVMSTNSPRTWELDIRNTTHGNKVSMSYTAETQDYPVAAGPDPDDQTFWVLHLDGRIWRYGVGDFNQSSLHPTNHNTFVVRQDVVVMPEDAVTLHPFCQHQHRVQYCGFDVGPDGDFYVTTLEHFACPTGTVDSVVLHRRTPGNDWSHRIPVAENSAFSASDSFCRPVAADRHNGSVLVHRVHPNNHILRYSADLLTEQEVIPYAGSVVDLDGYDGSIVVGATNTLEVLDSDGNVTLSRPVDHVTGVALQHTWNGIAAFQFWHLGVHEGPNGSDFNLHAYELLP